MSEQITLPPRNQPNNQTKSLVLLWIQFHSLYTQPQ